MIPIKLRLVRPGEDIGELLLQALKKQRLSLVNGDILAVASKIVSIAENRLVRLVDIRISEKARHIARKWRMNRRIASIIVEEADFILGGVPGFLLTIKNEILTANAGVDTKNSPPGTVALWPKDADESARIIRRTMQSHYNRSLGVEIVDSRVTPLRVGTVGLAIGLSGFLPVNDTRGKQDLYGRNIRFTQRNIADDLASAAHLLMGEACEQVGLVVIRNAPVQVGESKASKARLDVQKCLITSNLSHKEIEDV